MIQLPVAFCAFLRAKFEPGADFVSLALPQFVQGIAVALFFVPLTNIALSHLPAKSLASASGLYNFLRILAGGVGTSIATTLWERREALHHAQLTEQITAYNPIANQALQQIQGTNPDPSAALSTLDRMIGSQAYAMATVDVQYLAAWMFLLLIPLLWFARPPFGHSAPVAAD